MSEDSPPSDKIEMDNSFDAFGTSHSDGLAEKVETIASLSFSTMGLSTETIEVGQIIATSCAALPNALCFSRA